MKQKSLMSDKSYFDKFGFEDNSTLNEVLIEPMVSRQKDFVLHF
jgi:hypothetical protein